MAELGHRSGSQMASLGPQGTPPEVQSIPKALLQLLLAAAPLLVRGARLQSPQSLAAGPESPLVGPRKGRNQSNSCPIGDTSVVGIQREVLGSRTSGLEGAWQGLQCTDGKTGGPE